MESSAGIEDETANGYMDEIVYDLNGRRITKKPLAPGIYIINGKKTHLKNKRLKDSLEILRKSL